MRPDELLAVSDALAALGCEGPQATEPIRLDIARSADGPVTVSFDASANRTYTVEWTSTVSGDRWQKLNDIVAQAVDRRETVADTALGDGMLFYQVVTLRQP